MKPCQLLMLCIFFFNLFFFSSCNIIGNSDENTTEQTNNQGDDTTNQTDGIITPAFILDSAQAYVTTREVITTATINPKVRATVTTNFFKITTNELEPASTNAEVSSFRSLSGGIYIELSDNRKFFVKSSDNSATQIETSGSFISQNSDGDLFFSDASIFRTSASTLESLNTTLDSTIVQSFSGNFAVIHNSDNSIFQIFDTVNNYRYNIQGCNGPGIVALSTSKALIDDCSSNALINITDGTRTAVSDIVNSWNHESLIDSTGGAILLSQTCPGTGSEYHLCHVDVNGTVTPLITSDISPGSSSCMNCGGPNSVLYGTGDYFIIRELSQVTAVQRGVDNKIAILSGYNVTKVSVRGSIVYYIAEDNQGNPKAGKYDLTTSEDTPLSISDALSDIQAIVN